MMEKRNHIIAIIVVREIFVPYAKEIKENIGGDFTLAEAIRLAKLDFFEEVCNRYL